MQDRKVIETELNRILERQYNPSLIHQTAKERARKLVSYAKFHVPYYRNMDEKHNKTGSDISSFDSVTRATISERFNDLCSDLIPYIRLFRRSTSGTSGNPITMIFDSTSINYSWVALGRSIRHLGFSLSRRENGFNNVVTIGSLPGQNWQGNIPLPNYPLMSRIYFYDGQLTDEILRCLEQIRNLKPPIVFGMPTALLYFMRLLKKYHQKHSKPKAIITSGEPLTTKIRKVLENYFDCNVYNQYSMTEIGNIACECTRCDGLHFESDRLIIEAIKPNTIQNAPELVITNLMNKALLLIRYRTGDVGRINYKKCSCGITYPRIMNIKGRLVDFFKRPDGSIFNPYIMSISLDKLGFRQYKVVQTAFNEIEFMYTPPHDHSSLKEAIRIIKNTCGEVNVSAIPVPSIGTGLKSATFLCKLRNPILNDL